MHSAKSVNTNTDVKAQRRVSDQYTSGTIMDFGTG